MMARMRATSADSVQSTRLERVVQGNRDAMRRWSHMLKPDMASTLPNEAISDLLQRANETVTGNSAR